MQSPVTSFIIPTLNEEVIIQDTIKSIQKYYPKNSTYEIIIVDNGSTDGTIEVAKQFGVIILSNHSGTIALSRNIGARKAKGTIFVFLDADVHLTLAWQKEFLSTIKSLSCIPRTITGSRCEVEDKNNWLSKYWFKRLAQEKSNYMNSGHLITTRFLFEKINGFNENLETAEDYDFSKRALESGAIIINNPNLVAVHTRYPKTIKAFIQRERWHGKEDCKSFFKFINSIQAIISFCHCVLLVICIFLSIFYRDFFFIIIYLFIIILVSAFYAYKKFKSSKTFKCFILTTAISYIYIIGRSLSLIDKITSILIQLISKICKKIHNNKLYTQN